VSIGSLNGNQPVEVGKSRDPVALFNAYVEFMKLMFANLFLLNAGSATALMTVLGGQSKSDLVVHLVTQQDAKWAITFFACRRNRPVSI
jgi:hypothetical protein